MEKQSQDLETYVFELTKLEAGFLNAAVVDFFHKMRRAAEEETLILFDNNNYLVAKSLWDKIEKQTKVGEWK